ncbi:hypothetical protein EMIHUDRAFT_246212 [Emiliania huxleyi CCMP1516]|uniref:Uncharacterized protein n=2 Tax=Emiliania huxleyi TaxID=2903 RepID=A0A0D3IUT7_EMIH1|nr:hypothetical protein EMIHUDRAFT_246212 [Emiliania huxleyi CCMP1516]EOD15022.1 hypothetical protein EMIHUDRAFT_246212 [Emiliania huxleyi CCMP1516]|eukprot:XP_005767451.1 hypothetical protein EMIHUDRAFT_246212 [Emiliania huxleyi CCMP1516]
MPSARASEERGHNHFWNRREKAGVRNRCCVRTRALCEKLIMPGARLSEAVVQRTEKGPVARSATPQASAGGPPEAVCGGHFPSVFRRAPAAPWLLGVSPSGFARPQRAVEAGKGEDARSAAQALRRSAPGRSAQRKAGRRPTETP